jgi:hypothetical protein
MPEGIELTITTVMKKTGCLAQDGPFINFRLLGVAGQPTCAVSK